MCRPLNVLSTELQNSNKALKIFIIQHYLALWLLQQQKQHPDNAETE